MEQKAVDILDKYRLMAIATLRPDGWPQATMVSYANDAPLSGSAAGGTTGALADQTGVFLPPRTIELQLSWRY